MKSRYSKVKAKRVEPGTSSAPRLASPTPVNPRIVILKAADRITAPVEGIPDHMRHLMETLADGGMDVVRSIYLMLAGALAVGLLMQLAPSKSPSLLARIRSWFAVVMALVIGLTLAYCAMLSLIAALYDKDYFYGVPLTIGYMAISLVLSAIGLLLNRFCGRSLRVTPHSPPR